MSSGRQPLPRFARDVKPQRVFKRDAKHGVLSAGRQTFPHFARDVKLQRVFKRDAKHGVLSAGRQTLTRFVRDVKPQRVFKRDAKHGVLFSGRPTLARAARDVKLQPRQARRGHGVLSTGRQTLTRLEWNAKVITPRSRGCPDSHTTSTATSATAVSCAAPKRHPRTSLVVHHSSSTPHCLRIEGRSGRKHDYPTLVVEKWPNKAHGVEKWPSSKRRREMAKHSTWR